MRKLKDLLIRHEGIRFKPYKCTQGKLTIGVGRNLDDAGLSAKEIEFLLDNDVARVSMQAVSNFDWYKGLDQVRQDVVLSMIFNLGLDGFKNFAKMIAAIVAGNFQQAAYEMLSSKWAEQVGMRAVELAHMMSTGEYQD